VTENVLQPEPRWPVVVAFAILAVLYVVLPQPLIVVSRWVLVGVVPLLLIPAVLAHRSGRRRIHHVLTFIANGVVTAALIASVCALVFELPEHLIAAPLLLRSAAVLWLSNILVFALWYWRLDAGGPHRRESRMGHEDGAFLFPQMALNASANPMPDQRCWSPDFFDYLFLSFNTSSALSPTDTQVLSRWAKLMMMAQSLISLTIIVILAARAVNVL
jgi:hypothetical protein